MVTATHAESAEPTLRTLDIRGLTVGGTTTLTIDGDDLGKSPRLLLPFPAKQTLKAGNTDKKATFDVTLPGDVVPGYHHLRVAAEGGVSLPVVIGVDKLTQSPFAAMVKDLPIALHGNVAGANVVETKFQGKAKQRVTIEVEAQRLGAKLRPIVHLYSPKKLQLTWVWGTPALFGDARIETILPEDGNYTVSLHDAEYAAAAPSFFRLKIGQWSHVDRVFPPVIATNQPATVSLLGSAAPQPMSVVAPQNANVLPLPWPMKTSDWCGPRPFVTISPHPEFMEQQVAGKLQELPADEVGVSGKLLAPNEEDRYRVAVQPGTKVKLEVFAERLGSPIDVALVVRDDKGGQLARGEDSPGTLDPVLEYTVPAKVASIIVGVVDAQGRGGPNALYRLVIDPQTPGTSSDGFVLTTIAQRVALPVGGRDVVPVLVDRRGGYRGPIDVSPALPLPAGVKLIGTTIPENADGTLVTIERTGAGFEPLITSWVGRNADGIEKTVRLKGHPLVRLQPWLATEFAFAPSSAMASEFAIDWRDLPTTAGIEPAKKLTLPVKLTRKASKDSVKLTLLTSQLAPLVNNQPDPNKTLRQEKAIELPATASTGDLVVLVPADLPAPSYDLTVQAELLGPGKKPIAVAYAPVRRMAVISPIALTLDGPNRVEAKLDAKKGATLKLQGKLARQGNAAKADVALALTGLPAGAKAEAVTLKGDATAFTLNVTFPPSVAPGEFKGVKLSASFAPNPKQANIRVRSREVELTVVLNAASK